MEIKRSGTFVIVMAMIHCLTKGEFQLKFPVVEFYGSGYMTHDYERALFAEMGKELINMVEVSGQSI